MPFELNSISQYPFQSKMEPYGPIRGSFTPKTNSIAILSNFYIENFKISLSCNRIVVSTSRCGRDNPGSNPGYSILFHSLQYITFERFKLNL